MDKSIHNRDYKLLIGMLRGEREGKLITQEQLASKLGVNQAIISKIETCERRIDYIEMRRICQAIGIDTLDFIGNFEKRLQL